MTNDTLSDRRPVMGGEAVITLVGGTQAILDESFNIAELCERSWSRFRDDSELTRLNNASGALVAVTPLALALVEAMREGFALTNGDFNPTLLPAVVGIGYEGSRVDVSRHTKLAPEARVYDSLDEIEMSDAGVRIPADMTLDSGGIGKGLVADIIVATAMNAGAAGVMASFSGDVVVAGQAPDGDAWRIGVEDPFSTEDHVQVVRLVSGSVVTSSQRKNVFTGGHHLIDPRTLSSAETNVQTVSVIAATGARAEVLAKSGFLRDSDEFLTWLPTVGAAGMIIDATGNMQESTNWQSFA